MRVMSYCTAGLTAVLVSIVFTETTTQRGPGRGGGRGGEGEGGGCCIVLCFRTYLYIYQYHGCVPGKYFGRRRYGIVYHSPLVPFPCVLVLHAVHVLLRDCLLSSTDTLWLNLFRLSGVEVPENI